MKKICFTFAIKYKETFSLNITNKFPKLSSAEINEGIFDGPQIKFLMRDNNFLESLNTTKKEAWLSFKDVVRNFLGNKKNKNYKQIVAHMLIKFRKLGYLMSLKVHFLHAHLDKFPENLEITAKNRVNDFIEI